jgi:ABC-type multidrug transport system fused ATPase/permease subunit
MDKILFLEDGKLAAVGTHKELCDTCPAYLNMVKLQELESSHSEEQAKEEADNV